MIRLAHLSDIHISAPQLEWQVQDFLNKRMAGWINHRWLGRRFRFRHGQTVLGRLFDDIKERQPNHVVFSGDATALGFESEIRTAARIMGIHDDAMPTGLAVPGNHDYATRPAAASGLFEQHFAKWQDGIRVHDEPYPFAQEVGNHWLIGVNSCTGNRWAWDASGRIGNLQTERFRLLLKKLDSRPKILVTHYPVCLSNGKKEKPWRGLRDLSKFMRIAVDGGICLWLHGHRHKGYHLPKSKLSPFPVICAGSATQSRLWSYCEYTIVDHHCRGVRRRYDPESGTFVDRDAFELPLPRTHSAVHVASS